MSEIKTGGPAFPVADPFLVHQPKTVDDARRLAEGMTLRDYFAAKAVQGLLSSVDQAAVESFAEYAYKVADAMLKAREGK